jgi:AcrR family transcriptional regulator
MPQQERKPLELLAVSGYDQLTIDSVAARARCSKATIYRRWLGKAVLVITAARRPARGSRARHRRRAPGPAGGAWGHALQPCRARTPRSSSGSSARCTAIPNSLPRYGSR